MPAVTLAGARLARQPHRYYRPTLRAAYTKSSLSGSACLPTWSKPLTTAITPPSFKLPPSWTRHYSSIPTNSSVNPIFAENTNSEQLSAPLQSLLEKQWNLDEERIGIAKTYYFKTYTKCLDFTQLVGIRSKSKNHHPTIIVKSGSVHIHWTTHFPRGLTQKDIDMAQYCDEQAATVGTVQQAGANKCAPKT